MKKDIRRKRTENYFIDALCDIIRNEGMNAATIRNVADRAGYNSATIYTYFENFSHLLLRAHFKFELELLEKIKSDLNIETAEVNYELWIYAYISMADYYLENINIFECMYVANFEDGLSEEMRTTHAQQSAFLQFTYDNLSKMSEKIHMPMQTIMRIHEACVALIVGTVLLNVKQRLSKPRTEILENLTKEIECLIRNWLPINKEA